MHKHRKRWGHFLKLLSTLALTILIVNGAFAQSPTFTGIDILFLVDQSGSMSGFANAEPSDPDNIRFQAVQFALNTLSDYRLGVPRETSFRMAVAYFGDHPATEWHIAMPWQEIGDSQNWEAQRDRLVTDLSPESFSTDHLGNTDFNQSFELAARLFSELPALPPAEHNLRVIVLLTDGAPNAPMRHGLDQDSGQTTAYQKSQDMEDLLAFTQATFDPAEYRLYVIGVDIHNNFWYQFADMWERIVGAPERATSVETPLAASQRFSEILVELVGIVSEEGASLGNEIALVNNEGQFAVPPYNQMLRVVVFKAKSDVPVTLTTPDGTVISGANPGPNVRITGRTGNIEVWNISNPLPGFWSFSAPPESSILEVMMDLILSNHHFIETDDVRNILATNPLAIQLHNNVGTPPPDYDDPLYNLDVTGTLTGPDGQSQTFTLTKADAGRYETTFTPLQPGQYSFVFDARTHKPDGSEWLIYGVDTPITFEVMPVDIQIQVAPTDGGRIREDIYLIAEVHDSHGRIVANPNLNLQTSVITASGESIADLVLNAEDDGSFTGSFQAEQHGSYTFVVRAQMPSPDGTSPLTVAEKTEGPYLIKPAYFVGLRLEKPDTDETHYTTGGMPPVVPLPLVIEVQAFDSDSQQPLDLESLATTPQPLQMRVLDESGADVTGDAALTPVAGETGLYRAEVEELGTGTFTVDVETQGQLVEDYFYGPGGESLSIKVVRGINPALILFVAGSVVLVVLIIAVGTVITMRRRKRREHPARGELTLYRVDHFQNIRDPIWMANLDGYKSNRIKIQKLSAEVPIQDLVIECPNEAMYQNKQILVSAKVGSRKIQRRSLFPGSEISLYQSMEENEQDYVLALKGEDELF